MSRPCRPRSQGPLAATHSVRCEHPVAASILSRGRLGGSGNHGRRDRRRRSLSSRGARPFPPIPPSPRSLEKRGHIGLVVLGSIAVGLDSWAGARPRRVRRRTRGRDHGCGPHRARARDADALRARSLRARISRNRGRSSPPWRSASLALHSSFSGRAVACSGWLGWVWPPPARTRCRVVVCGVRAARFTTGPVERFFIRPSSSWDWSPLEEHSRPSPRRRRVTSPRLVARTSSPATVSI